MRLKRLSVQNFRALENVTVDFTGIADVIVGPNAIGKTTILEAIRLSKAVLAARTLDEAQHALVSLGAASQHVPQQINIASLMRDPKLPLSIECRYELAQAEIDALNSLIPMFARMMVQSSMGMTQQNALVLVQFLSSPQGRDALAKAQLHCANSLPQIKNSKACILHLNIDPVTRVISGTDQMSQLIFSALEGRLRPHEALFSYFPADRAMPTGEINVQLGGPEVNAQLSSHNSQPQTKYHRLKATILHNYLLNATNPTEVLDDFKRIFGGLLKDREIGGLRINEFGLISIQVKDLTNNRLFDIDNMSSGEKGLILTFLLIGRSVANNGIVLIDEPELHLNPAVCKILLPFLIDQYLAPKNIQAIICSHSPEVLGVAFDRADCALHHLQSPTVISPILPRDRQEVFDALRRLGTSTSEVLFSNGSIFVEGEDDLDILGAGFSSLLTRYNVTQLGGRRNIEQDIRTLQQAEARGEVDSLKCFIFDLDHAPTALASTTLVRVLQWKRHCIENYLINEDVIYEFLRDDEVSKSKIDKRGEVNAIFKEVALGQLRGAIADGVYKKITFENIGPPEARHLYGKSFNECAAFLFGQLSKMQQQICGLDNNGWSADFESQCNAEYVALLPRWEADWLTLCDGKRFFHDLQARYRIKMNPRKLKIRIMERMARDKADGWILIESVLRDALKI